VKALVTDVTAEQPTRTEATGDVLRHLIDLGELAHGTLSGERMEAFLQRSWKLLEEKLS